MLKEDVTHVELMRQARSLAQRLGQIMKEIEQLGELAGSVDHSVSSADEWLREQTPAGEWRDITSFHTSHSDWMTAKGLPPMSLKSFCTFMHTRGGVMSRKHPKTRRVQVWF